MKKPLKRKVVANRLQWIGRIDRASGEERLTNRAWKTEEVVEGEEEDKH